MSTDTKAVPTAQPDNRPASDDLELKSVGRGNFVSTYHRNAYGMAPRREA